MENRAHEIFGDSIIGEFHSHPEVPPTASEEDIRQMIDNTTPYIGDGSFMFIVGIHPLKRKPWWSFKTKAYRLVGEKVKRVDF
jgi:proteasome lid subunit RPN8/RPN11